MLLCKDMSLYYFEVKRASSFVYDSSTLYEYICLSSDFIIKKVK